MRVRTAHISLQFGDTDQNHTADIEKIFDRCVDRRVGWITGTEAGPGAGNTTAELVRIGREHNYRMYVPSASNGAGSSTDCWIGVRKDLISRNWKTGFDPAIPGSKQLYKELGVKAEYPKWGPRGLVRVGFDCDALQSRVNVGAAHYLTHGRDPEGSTIHGVDHWEWNNKLAEVIGAWARTSARGRNLAFYAGDQNMADAKNNEPQGDTFFGEPLTSLADELKKWQSTGHGPIDVIASYNNDGRVTGHDFVVLDDSEFRLNVDHFYLEGTFTVEPITS